MRSTAPSGGAAAGHQKRPSTATNTRRGRSNSRMLGGDAASKASDDDSLKTAVRVGMYPQFSHELLLRGEILRKNVMDCD